MKFGNELWLILFRVYISPNLFAVHVVSYVDCRSLLSPLSAPKITQNWEDSKVEKQPIQYTGLKGTVSQDFCFWFFFMNQFPPSP